MQMKPRNTNLYRALINRSIFQFRSGIHLTFQVIDLYCIFRVRSSDSMLLKHQNSDLEKLDQNSLTRKLSRRLGLFHCMFWNNVLKGLDKWESPLSCKNRFCRRFGLCLCHRRTYNLHLHDRAIYIIKVGSCKQVNKVYFNMCLAIH